MATLYGRGSPYELVPDCFNRYRFYIAVDQRCAKCRTAASTRVPLVVLSESGAITNSRHATDAAACAPAVIEAGPHRGGRAIRCRVGAAMAGMRFCPLPALDTRPAARPELPP
jgi:hypothetical protein